MKKALFILIVILLGCNTEKRAARREEKSWDVYSTSPRLIQRSVPLVSALYPCIVKNEIVRNDTTFLYHVDTVIKKVAYEVYKDKVLDTVIGEISIYADSTGITVKYLGKEKIITKTKETVKIDQSEVNRLNDSLNNSKVKEATLKGQILQIEKRVNQEIDETNKYKTYFFVYVAFTLVVVGAFLYIKFKTKVPIP